MESNQLYDLEERTAEHSDELKDDARILWKEVQELTLIFGRIVSSLKN